MQALQNQLEHTAEGNKQEMEVTREKLQNIHRNTVNEVFKERTVKDSVVSVFWKACFM